MILFSSLLTEGLYSPLPTKVWYHGTSYKNAKLIMEQGFRLDTKSTGYDLYGKGIYFATPPHLFGDAKAFVEVTFDASWKLPYLKGEDQYVAFDEELKRLYPNSPNILHDEWKNGTIKLGYDGFAMDKDDPPYYTGDWLTIYNIEKLNSMPRVLKRVRAFTKGQ